MIGSLQSVSQRITQKTPTVSGGNPRCQILQKNGKRSHWCKAMHLQTLNILQLEWSGVASFVGDKRLSCFPLGFFGVFFFCAWREWGFTNPAVLIIRFTKPDYLIFTCRKKAFCNRSSPRRENAKSPPQVLWNNRAYVSIIAWKDLNSPFFLQGTAGGGGEWQQHHEDRQHGMERNGGEETAAVAPGLCFSNFTEYQDHRSPRKACPKMPGLSSRVSSSLGRGQEPRWCICKSLSDINADNDPAITLGELLKVTASASSRLSCTSLQGSSQFLKMKRYVCVCWQTGGLVLCFPIARAPTLHFAQPQAQHCGLQAWWPCQEDHPAGMNACKIFQLSPVPWPAPLAGKHTGQGHPYAQRDCLLLQVSQPPPPPRQNACQRKKKIHKCVRAFDKGLPWPCTRGSLRFHRKATGKDDKTVQFTEGC